MAHGEGCDLSETGVAFIGPRVFAPGNEITVHYRLGANVRDDWSRTRAVVRNCAGRRMGVEFCIIHPRDRAQLREITRAEVEESATASDMPLDMPPDTSAVVPRTGSTDRLECDPIGNHSRPCAE